MNGISLKKKITLRLTELTGNSEQISNESDKQSFRDHSCPSSLTRKQILTAEISFLCNCTCPHPAESLGGFLRFEHQYGGTFHKRKARPAIMLVCLSATRL